MVIKTNIKKLSLFVSATLSIFVLANAIGHKRAAAATITVDSIADTVASDSACTFREAIGNMHDQADTNADCTASGAYASSDTINFGISGGSYKISVLTSGYVVDHPLVIDGLSQSGSTTTNPLIELDGTGTSGSSSPGIDVRAANVTISGLRILDFDSQGINVNDASYDNAIVEYCVLTDNGQKDPANGIRFQYASNLTARGNVLSGNSSDGISLTGVDGATIVGNTIYSHVNNIGLYDSSNITIGTSNSADRNIIYDSSSAGRNIYIVQNAGTTQHIKIQNNYIGINASGNIPGSTSQRGIVVQGGVDDVLVGGTGANQGNVIRGNVGAGVIVLGVEVQPSAAVSPSDVSILGNDIDSNTTAGAVLLPGLVLPGLGIDNINLVLDGSFNIVDDSTVGSTVNDAGDGDTGANNLMNFPVINSTTQNGTAVTVNFNLDAADSTSGNYRVEFFANDSAGTQGYGEGQTYLGAATVSNGDSQTANITVPSNIDLTGKYITATTTAINTGTTSGFGSTSEFSAAKEATVVSSQLANTGQNIIILITIAGALIVSGGAIMARSHSHSSKFTLSK